MAKGYWISRVDVHDPQTYKSYVETARPAFERFGAKFLVRGGRTDVIEGPAAGRIVVIEFASLADARACHDSPEYQQALQYRHAASTGETLLVEGA